MLCVCLCIVQVAIRMATIETKNRLPFSESFVDVDTLRSFFLHHFFRSLLLLLLFRSFTTFFFLVKLIHTACVLHCKSEAKCTCCTHKNMDTQLNTDLCELRMRNQDYSLLRASNSIEHLIYSTTTTTTTMAMTAMTVEMLMCYTTQHIIYMYVDVL